MGHSLGSCPLAERELELETMAATARAATDSGARLILVTGEQGAGKSRLWSEFEQRLGEGWQRLEVAAHRTDRSPMAPFDPLLGDVPSEGDAARALGGALAAALRSRAAEGPMALLVEDLHWFDPLPITALVHAIRLLADAPVLIVATFRLGEGPRTPQARAVADVLRQPRVQELRLSALSEEAVVRLVKEMRGRDDPDLAAAVHLRTGGNPLFVEEVLRDPGPGVPWTVAEAIDGRVDRLEPPAQHLAGLLAAAGEPLPTALVAELADQVGASLRTLVDVALVVELDGSVGLRHAVVGEVLLARLSATEQRQVHATIAIAIERAPDPKPERLAHHWSAAGETERAAVHAAVAADRFEGHRTYETATELYRIALRHPPTDEVERVALYERAAAAAALAGANDLARAWVDEARRSYVEAERPWLAGRVWVNPTLAARADSRDQGPDSDAAGLLDRSQRAVRSGDLEGGRDLARRAHEAALQHGDLAAAAFSALALVYAGEVDAGRALLQELLEAASATGDHARQTQLLGYLSRTSRITGDAAGALELNRRALVCARSAGDEGLWPHVQAAVAYVLAWHGHVDEADRLAGELLALDETLFTAMAQVPLAMTDLACGRFDLARERVEPLIPAVRSLGVDYFTLGVLRLMAHVELAQGDPRRALALLDEAADVVWSPLYEWHGDHLELRARAAFASGDRAQLGRVATRLDELAGGADRGPAFLAPASTVRGLVALAGGRVDEAAGRFEAAARSWEEASCWRPAADAWCDAAEAGASSATVDRAAALAEAHGLSHAGSRAIAARTSGTIVVAQELARLTPRERDIVLLVGARRTNREIAAELFLSEKTVRNYLSSAFAKLGISRRAEIVDLVARAAAGP